MTEPKIDKNLCAHFREWARRIIAQDRAARKYGQSQNTIGEIERTLAQAFMLGHKAAKDGTQTRGEPASAGFVEWIEIPARARDTLFSIGVSFRRIDSEQATIPPVIFERVLIGGRHRWRSTDDHDRDAHSFSDGGVVPLVKLALLRPLDEAGERLCFTELGAATCREFWRRWDERDPTLPLMGVRS